MGKVKIYIAGLLVILLIILLVVKLFPSENRTFRWVFAYYMSYDNDLNHHGKTILNQLEKGIINDDIAVVIQADFSDIKGMKRIALYKANGKVKRKETAITSENSSDPNELKKYFDWVCENWKAENYCVVFLNHGGTLNNMCSDIKPFRKTKENNKLQAAKWLPAAQAGKVVADFNHNVAGNVRLLFLQQCARGSIQNLYNFTNTSEYVMASPVIVGAPNTYYTQMLQAVSNDPNITGKTISQTIMSQDKDYTIYTLLDCNELSKLPEKLEPVLDSFLRAQSMKPPQDCKPLFENEIEKFYDLKSYFLTLSQVNNDVSDKELNVFFDWIDNHLILEKRLNENSSLTLDKSMQSGLSIYVPTSKSELGRYDFLPIYKQTKLEDLHRLMLQ
jgi:hypothetical protein